MKLVTARLVFEHDGVPLELNRVESMWTISGPVYPRMIRLMSFIDEFNKTELEYARAAVQKKKLSYERPVGDEAK